MTDGADFGALICNRVAFINFLFAKGQLMLCAIQLPLHPFYIFSWLNLPSVENLVGLELQAVHFQSKAGLELLL